MGADLNCINEIEYIFCLAENLKVENDWVVDSKVP